MNVIRTNSLIYPWIHNQSITKWNIPLGLFSSFRTWFCRRGTSLFSSSSWWRDVSPPLSPPGPSVFCLPPSFCQESPWLVETKTRWDMSWEGTGRNRKRQKKGSNLSYLALGFLLLHLFKILLFCLFLLIFFLFVVVVVIIFLLLLFVIFILICFLILLFLGFDKNEMLMIWPWSLDLHYDIITNCVIKLWDKNINIQIRNQNDKKSKVGPRYERWDVRGIKRFVPGFSPRCKAIIFSFSGGT